MPTVPFSSEQFFAVFAEYNRAVWPAQPALTAAALVSAALALRNDGRLDRWVAAFLAGLWVWTGVAYHVLHFTTINPAAYAFGTAFVLEGALIFRTGVVRGQLSFALESDPRGAAAALLLVYAVAVYPLLGIAAGHAYLAGPTFGAPCPVVIYTFGMLLLVRGVPLPLLAIPALWAVIGSSATFAFGVWQDLGLPISAALALAFHFRDRTTTRERAPRAAASAAGRPESS